MKKVLKAKLTRKNSHTRENPPALYGVWGIFWSRAIVKGLLVDLAGFEPASSGVKPDMVAITTIGPLGPGLEKQKDSKNAKALGESFC